MAQVASASGNTFSVYENKLNDLNQFQNKVNSFLNVMDVENIVDLLKGNKLLTTFGLACNFLSFYIKFVREICKDIINKMM